jgi:hypothetical protein
LIQELIEGTSLDGRLSTNNLHCVSLECSPGTCTGSTLRETCPLEFYALISGLPLVCAATCDRFACPPNFSCAKSASPDSPPACMPGLPGLRCTSPVDCIVGDCIDTGAGFSVCTLPAGCNNDEECIASLGSNPPFVCVENAPGAGRHCFSSVSFHGANCSESSDCSAELRCGSEACPPRDCFRDSPGLPPSDHGECRFSCEPGTPCPSFGGLPHACLEDGGCFPGSFAVPCSSSADCFANLTCETVPTDERSLGQSTEICTASCGTDDDCTSNPWIGNGYCVAVPDPVPGTAGYCRLAGQPGTPCARDTQCIFENCEIGVCGDPPG